MTRLSSVAIRRASDDDLPEMLKIESSAKSAIADNWLTGSGDRYTGEGVFSYLSEDDRPFGFVASGSPVEEYFRDGQTGEILSLYIHPDYQGYGVGKKLLVHGLTVLKRRGFDTAIAWVPSAAERAISILMKLNFEKVEGAWLTDNQTGGMDHECFKLDLTCYF